jgi:CO/xanthine dehydrogenase Mo-binding subunit
LNKYGVGQPVRHRGPVLVQGQGAYTDDGASGHCGLRARRNGARRIIKNIDTAAAKGCRRARHLRRLAAYGTMKCGAVQEPRWLRDEEASAPHTDKVRFVGDPIAVVVTGP